MTQVSPVADSMPAAVMVEVGKLEVQERPVPTLGPRDALVEVAHCGICGTDLHIVLEGLGGRAGAIGGHEWSGTLVAVGDEVEGWELGALVVAGPVPGCGHCRACRRGRPSVCASRPRPGSEGDYQGAFARYVKVDAARLLRVPDGVTARAAALTEPLSIAIHAVTIAGGTRPDQHVLVTGGGPIGQLVTAVLRAQGCEDVTVSEPHPLRRERALAIGARRVIEPGELQRATTGAVVDDPYEVVYECSGNPNAVTAAFEQLDLAGTLVLVGTGSSYPTINHNRAIIHELTIVGIVNYDPEGWAPALDLLATGRVPVDLLIEPEIVPLAGLQDVMLRLVDGQLPGKVMITPSA